MKTLFPFLVFLLPLTAFLPFDLPIGWNHLFGKLHTLFILSLYLFFVLFRALTLPRLTARIRVFSVRNLFLLYLFPVLSLGGAGHFHRPLDVDEPGYFLTVQSLAQDSDLNVADNFDPKFINVYLERVLGVSKDLTDTLNYIRYANAIFHRGTMYREDGRWTILFPVEPLALLLWTLPYLLLGLPGIILLQCMAIALGLALLTRYLSDKHGLPFPRLVQVFFGLTLILPVNCYMARLWPETLCFLFLALYLHFSSKHRVVLGLVFASLTPWLHIRYMAIPFAAAIGHLFLQRQTSLAHRLLPALLIPAFSLTALIGFNRVVHYGMMPGSYTSTLKEGQATPQAYLRSFEKAAIDSVRNLPAEPRPLFRLLPPHRLLIYLLGNNQGLAVYAPVFLAALLLLVKLDVMFLLAPLAYLAFISAWAGGGAEEYAPGRYVVCIAPFLFSGLAFLSKRHPLLSLLWVLSFGLACAGFLSREFLDVPPIKDTFLALDTEAPFWPRNALILGGWLAAFALVRRTLKG